ncbi:MAG: putative methionine--tRNA ligase, cytoplasmic protein rar1 [Cirrosporium novae-zelandiae]|nr:MAG: putative methionine--tRNA ligase, cytoplasmic protein rar1 [Cirrosporium novae-zelandiae]
MDPQASGQKILPRKGETNILITSALPYVNNVPHLGNIIGSVLSADVFARYNKARGNNTLFVCGTDEYGTATETKALEEKVTPQELCSKYHKIHAEVYDWFEIGFDIFGRTPTENHTKISQDMFMRLYDNGYLVEKETEQPYCETHKSFLADRFVEGECPRCGYEDARGDQCDKCGNLLNPFELIKPHCKLDGSAPIKRKTKHMHLLLDKLQPEVEKWSEKASNDGAWSKNGRIITESWLKEGLKDRGITRDLKWGVPVPLEGWDNKVLYVWFEACIGYVSITANYTGGDDWQKWWRDPENVRLYQFLGKDNVPFHTVIFPACQIGTGEKWTQLHHLSTTEYLNYENGKFSKSRGVGVFGNNAKETGIPPDVWRYYLIKNRPETGDTQFEWKYFIGNNNNELLANLGNFVNRIIKLVNSKHYNSVLPDYTKYSDESLEDRKEKINTLLTEYTTELESVHLRAGLEKAMHIAGAGNELIQANKLDNALIASSPDRAAAVIGLAINLIYLCASIFHPYLPATSASILQQLNAPFLTLPDFRNKKWASDDLKPGHQIGKAKYLFSRIDEKKEDEWRAMFGGSQEDRKKKEEEAAKVAAKKAANKAKKSAKKQQKKKDADGTAVKGGVEGTAKQGAQDQTVEKDAVDVVTEGVEQVTIPTS